MFTVFTAGAKMALIESLVTTFGPLFQGSDFAWNYRYFIIGFLVLVPFVLILASLIILVDVSTTIVRKKHEGKITGKHETDNAYRKMAYSLTGEISYKDETYSMKNFFKEYKDGSEIYPNFVKSFDIIISAVSFLILFVYTKDSLLTQSVDKPGLRSVLSNSFKTGKDNIFNPTNSTIGFNWLTQKFTEITNKDYEVDTFTKLFYSIFSIIIFVAIFLGGWAVVIAIFIAAFITLIVLKITKETFNFQFSKQGWPLITYLCSLILGSIGVAYSGEALKLKSRMRDDIFGDDIFE
jgi:hypothetical protein